MRVTVRETGIRYTPSRSCYIARAHARPLNAGAPRDESCVTSCPIITYCPAAAVCIPWPRDSRMVCRVTNWTLARDASDRFRNNAAAELPLDAAARARAPYCPRTCVYARVYSHALSLSFSFSLLSVYRCTYYVRASYSRAVSRGRITSRVRHALSVSRDTS